MNVRMGLYNSGVPWAHGTRPGSERLRASRVDQLTPPQIESCLPLLPGTRPQPQRTTPTTTCPRLSEPDELGSFTRIQRDHRTFTRPS